jgi:hypothetical protein
MDTAISMQPSFALNPLQHNRVAIALIDNDIKPAKSQFNQHGVGDTCWCHPQLRAIGRGTLVFNHIGGGETAKVHNYPRYYATAVGEV